MYKSLIRPILFRFDPESIHHRVFGWIRNLHKIPGSGALIRNLYRTPERPVEAFGLRFRNPVGLAAGFDKDAKLFDELANFGFGFIEVGTVTPRPQPGNEKPRMFRLPADQGIINRMGFNNEGVEALAARLQKRKTRDLIIGGNIGKNKVTPNEEALKDYLICFDSLFPYVDYFVVNVSSPNTPNLRALQDKEPLKRILNALMEQNRKQETLKPVLLKIAPDLSNAQLDDIVEIVAETGISGLIATNTTISRDGLQSDESLRGQQGGLSGRPLTQRSTEVVKYLYERSAGKLDIIAVGGIFTAEDAREKLDAGARLVQVYTGFIYEGPAIVQRIVRGLH